MTTDTTAANGSHPLPPPADMVAVETTAGQEQPAEPGQATYADISPPERAALRPIIPEHLSTWAGIKSEATLQAHRHAHRTAYHGIRLPWYLLQTIWYALCGALYLAGRIVMWWHWLDGKILESQAVARGPAGHNDAMKAHTQGLKTRSQRGKILLVCLVLAAGVLHRRWPCSCRGGAGMPSPLLPRWSWPATPSLRTSRSSAPP